MQTKQQAITEPHTHLAHRPPMETELQWGSDPSFQYHGFSCPIGSWTEERLVRDMMRNVAFMCRSIDIDLNTQPEIPQIANHEHIAEEWLSLDDLDLPSLSDVAARVPSVPSLSPDLDSNTDSTTPEPLPRVCSPQKRKRSTSTRKRKCVQKPGQALCHCQTEKRRRTTIGHGYESLSRVVPALRGQSFTRKYVLEGAANYVQHLIDGNRDLQQQLDDMKAKGITVGRSEQHCE